MQDEVRVYYEKNTPRFLRFGGGGDVGAIHRKVWAPEVKTRDEAFLYVNRCIEVTIHEHFLSKASPLRIIDLGCGVGGTALWLSEHLNAFVTGISNSPLQVRIAQQKAISSAPLHHERNLAFTLFPPPL